MRGRPPSILKGKRKESEKTILSELERASGTFTELRERTGLADSTLSMYLKKLEGQGSVVRELIGRKVVYKLSAKTLDPVDTTIRHLEAIVPPSSKFNGERGRELLTKDVTNAIVEFDKKSLESAMQFIPEFFKPQLERMFKFNEITLIKTLARHSFERDQLPKLLKRMPSAERKFYRELISSLKKRGLIYYGLAPFLKKRGMDKQFDGLLEWMKPILETRNPLSELFNWELSFQLGEFSRLKDTARALMLLSEIKSGKISKKKMEKLKERFEKLKGGEKA